MKTPFAIAARNRAGYAAAGQFIKPSASFVSTRTGRFSNNRSPLDPARYGGQTIFKSPLVARARAISFDIGKKLPKFPESVPLLPALRDSLSGIVPMFQRILIAARRARPRCATVHAATLFIRHSWRLAKTARSGPRPAAGARQHRSDIAPVRERHFILMRAFLARRERVALLAR